MYTKETFQEKIKLNEKDNGVKEITKEVKHKIDYILKNNKNLEVIIPFRKIAEDMKFKCNKCGETFRRKPQIFLKTQKCPYCESRSKLKPRSVFLKDLSEKYGNEYKLLGEYINAQTPTLFEHTPCGFKWKCKPNDILYKASCPRCHSSRRKRKVQNLNKQ